MKANPTYTAVMMQAKDGTFTGYIEEVPAVISQGNNEQELRENLLDALQMMLDYYKVEARKFFRKTPSLQRKREILSLV